MKCHVKKVIAKILLGFFLVSIMACGGGGTSGTGGEITATNLRQFIGTVSNSNKEPIANVTVTIKETGDTTKTDSKGKFEISSEVGDAAVLVFNGASIDTSVSVNNLTDNSKPVQIAVVVDKSTGVINSQVDSSKKPQAPAPAPVDPQVCPTVYQPVCGIDNNTYGNSCEAKREGVFVAYQGECEQESTTPNCTQEFVLVCGADGKTYSNRCYAISAGTTVLYEGECGAPTCSRVYAPVCGANGETYFNECEAAEAGVTVSYQGECSGNHVF